MGKSSMVEVMLKGIIEQKAPEIMATIATKVIGWLRTQKAEDLNTICEEMAAQDALALRAMWRAVQVPATDAKP